MDVNNDFPAQSERLDLKYETFFNVNLSNIMESSRSDGLGWGAGPLNAYATPEVQAQQAAIMSGLIDRVSFAPEENQVPEAIQQYMITNFFSRHTNRTMANFDNFSNRAEIVPTQEQQIIIERGIPGHASPAELAYIRNLLQFPSVELACLSHPYGKNIEKLDEMRMAIDEMISILGGERFDGDAAAPVFKVKQIDGIMYHQNSHNATYLQEPLNDEHEARSAINRKNDELLNGMLHVHNALLMTRKRDIGKLSDGSIVRERSSFILRIDQASGFDPGLADQMRQVRLYQDDKSLQTLMDVGGLKILLPELLAVNDFKQVVPNSTTVYAFNRQTQRNVTELKKRSETHAARRALAKVAFNWNTES